MILERLKKLCNEKKISMYKLESDLEFSRGSISKWGKSMPAADKLKAAADYFNVSIEYFLEEEKES